MPSWLRLTPARAASALVLVAAGLIFAASARTAAGTDLRGDRATELRDLIRRQAYGLQETQARVDALVRDNARLADEQGGSTALDLQRARVAALSPAAGLTEVVGPGLTVSLNDAVRPAGGGEIPGNPSPDDLVVHQGDVQAVVNAMWRGGASAMRIMDQRVVSTSAVRCVGNTLILQGRVYSPPFRITAVGDVAGMKRSLADDSYVSIYREFVKLYGLGYDEAEEASVTLPPYAGPIEPRYATPIEREPAAGSTASPTASPAASTPGTPAATVRLP